MSIDPAVILVLLLALSWHEAAHAWVADRLGDPTARELGRISLNPLRHLDPFLSVVLPVAVFLMSAGTMIFGGGKPVPIQPSYFRQPSRDCMLVALAGPGSNLALALLAVVLFAVGSWSGLFPPEAVDVGYGEVRYATTTLQEAGDGGFLARTLYWGVFINVLLAAFNLIPVPPLDGSRVVGWLLPGPLKRSWYSLDRYGLLILLVIFYWLDGLRYLTMVFVPIYNAFADLSTWLLALVPP